MLTVPSIGAAYSLTDPEANLMPTRGLFPSGKRTINARIFSLDL
jgi:hypothetical protein